MMGRAIEQLVCLFFALGYTRVLCMITGKRRQKSIVISECSASLPLFSSA